jgi:hypothetical protein
VLVECGWPPAAAVVLVERGCTAAVPVERDCTAVATDGCPRTVVEGDAAVPRVGCRSCGAPLELPSEGPDTALFRFFSSAASQAFMVPSWSMAALASLLYDRFYERIRRSCN